MFLSLPVLFDRLHNSNSFGIVLFLLNLDKCILGGNLDEGGAAV